MPGARDIQMGVWVVHAYSTRAGSGFFPPEPGMLRPMSLRGQPIEEEAVLSDGRAIRIRIGVPDDPYIRRRELRTVAVELWDGERVLATVNSILSVDQTAEARRLAREIAGALETGELEPTAGAIEPLAERIP